MDELLNESKRLPEPMAPFPVLGIHMLAPPLLALPFIPVVSFWEFLRAWMCVGEIEYINLKTKYCK